MIVAHALFKAALFMVVGIVDHRTHTRDLRKLTGLRRRMPGLAVITVLAAASMAGLPPMFGFVAKESAFGAFTSAIEQHGEVAPTLGVLPGALVLGGVVLGSVLTIAYTLRFVWGIVRATSPVSGAGRPSGAGRDRRAPAPSWLSLRSGWRSPGRR